MAQVLKVKKREGHITNFDNSKIQNAIYKALLDVNTPDSLALSGALTDIVISKITDDSISIEKIQDIVEITLLEEKLVEAARHYILYRDEKRKIREEKKKILQKDTLDDVDKSFSLNQLRVLAERYLLRDLKTNKIIESPSEMFRRVATLIGLSDLLHDPTIFDVSKEAKSDFGQAPPPPYDSYSQILKERFINEHHYNRFCNLYQELDKEDQMRFTFREVMDKWFVKLFDSKYEKKIQEYYNLMVSCTFMPNTPTLMNAGTSNSMLSACYVLNAEDHIDAYIRDTVGDAAQIYRGAGGVGINFSKFRPEGSSANGIPNAASGPVSFMHMIDTLTNVVKSGGRRRGANLACLDVFHPDIEKFITMKSTPGVLENFNVSVGIWDEFWGALTSGKTEFELSHPTHPEKNKIINPQHLWDLIALSAWKSAEPGILLFDNVNKVNHMKNDMDVLNASNPCGEQMLYPNSSCTLGSINISKCIDENGSFDWLMFESSVRDTTRFLDNVVSMNKYPTSKIEEMALKERRIGLGIMGLADTLFQLGIPYNSKDGFEFMGQICKMLTTISIDESINIAIERGPAPLFNYKTQGIDINNKRTRSSLSIRDSQDNIYKYGIRNTWNTTVAPTGTISMIAGCSSGIEPEFALGFEKKVTIGSFFYSNKYLAEALKKEGLYSEELLKKIAENGGSIQSIEEIPEHIKQVFVTAMDIHWADHVMAQAACQQYIDNSISKTVNMANDVLVDDIKNAYLLAHELGCKGLSVYRDGSRAAQVLHTNSEKTGKQLKPSQYTLQYIKEHITNPYVLEKLETLLDTEKDIEDKLRASFGNQLTIGSISSNPRLIDSGMITVHVTDTCPSCSSKLMFKEGCKTCSCGWSACSVS